MRRHRRALPQSVSGHLLSRLSKMFNPPMQGQPCRMFRLAGVTGLDWVRYRLTSRKSFALYAARKILPKGSATEPPMFLELPDGTRYRMLQNPDGSAASVEES